MDDSDGSGRGCEADRAAELLGSVHQARGCASVFGTNTSGHERGEWCVHQATADLNHEGGNQDGNSEVPAIDNGQPDQSD
ncbi:hypothetical protein L5G32_18505 [Gordonia sp. HY002]|nr:hypothetical protein [Gordonia zhenghanii]MCF8572255.1 hypothetical protein [Gordonia zhenghanii]MCF8607580.1 hypothetical protein [Gordonia zhenghanii]